MNKTWEMNLNEEPLAKGIRETNENDEALYPTDNGALVIACVRERLCPTLQEATESMYLPVAL